jgi:actin-related protein
VEADEAEVQQKVEADEAEVQQKVEADEAEVQQKVEADRKKAKEEEKQAKEEEEEEEEEKKAKEEKKKAKEEKEKKAKEEKAKEEKAEEEKAEEEAGAKVEAEAEERQVRLIRNKKVEAALAKAEEDAARQMAKSEILQAQAEAKTKREQVEAAAKRREAAEEATRKEAAAQVAARRPNTAPEAKAEAKTSAPPVAGIRRKKNQRISIAAQAEYKNPLGAFATRQTNATAEEAAAAIAKTKTRGDCSATSVPAASPTAPPASLAFAAAPTRKKGQALKLFRVKAGEAQQTPNRTIDSVDSDAASALLTNDSAEQIAVAESAGSSKAPANKGIALGNKLGIASSVASSTTTDAIQARKAQNQENFGRAAMKLFRAKKAAQVASVLKEQGRRRVPTVPALRPDADGYDGSMANGVADDVLGVGDRSLVEETKPLNALLRPVSISSAPRSTLLSRKPAAAAAAASAAAAAAAAAPKPVEVPLQSLLGTADPAAREDSLGAMRLPLMVMCLVIFFCLFAD